MLSQDSSKRATAVSLVWWCDQGSSGIVQLVSCGEAEQWHRAAGQLWGGWAVASCSWSVVGRLSSGIVQLVSCGKAEQWHRAAGQLWGGWAVASCSWSVVGRLSSSIVQLVSCGEAEFQLDSLTLLRTRRPPRWLDGRSEAAELTVSDCYRQQYCQVFVKLPHACVNVFWRTLICVFTVSSKKCCWGKRARMSLTATSTLTHSQGMSTYLL